MKIPGVRFLVPVLIGSMFAACSPTRTVTRSVTAADFMSVRNVVIDNLLYYARGVRADTLVCTLRTQQSPTADGIRIPITAQDARTAGLDDDNIITPVFRTEAVLLSSGDTLLIPLQSIDAARMGEINPGFVAGAMIGGGVVTIIILSGLALGALFMAALGR